MPAKSDRLDLIWFERQSAYLVVIWPARLRQVPDQSGLLISVSGSNRASQLRGAAAGS